MGEGAIWGRGCQRPLQVQVFSVLGDSRPRAPWYLGTWWTWAWLYSGPVILPPGLVLTSHFGLLSHLPPGAGTRPCGAPAEAEGRGGEAPLSPGRVPSRREQIGPRAPVSVSTTSHLQPALSCPLGLPFHSALALGAPRKTPVFQVQIAAHGAGTQAQDSFVPRTCSWGFCRRFQLCVYDHDSSDGVILTFAKTWAGPVPAWTLLLGPYPGGGGSHGCHTRLCLVNPRGHEAQVTRQSVQRSEDTAVVACVCVLARTHSTELLTTHCALWCHTQVALVMFHACCASRCLHGHCWGHRGCPVWLCGQCALRRRTHCQAAGPHGSRG